MACFASEIEAVFVIFGPAALREVQYVETRWKFQWTLSSLDLKVSERCDSLVYLMTTYCLCVRVCSHQLHGLIQTIGIKWYDSKLWDVVRDFSTFVRKLETKKQQQKILQNNRNHQKPKQSWMQDNSACFSTVLWWLQISQLLWIQPLKGVSGSKSAAFLLLQTFCLMCLSKTKSEILTIIYILL